MNILGLQLLALAAVAAEILPPETTFNSKFISLLKDIYKAEQLQGVLVLKKSNESFAEEFGEDLVKDVSVSLGVPIILTTEDSSFFVKRKFSDRLLVIVCLKSISDEVILQGLLENLRQMTTCKTIFLLDFPSKDEKILRDLFEFCWKNDMINILAFFQDFLNTSTFYRYTNIPEFVIQENHWTGIPPTDGYFPNRMQDLKGYELPVLFGGSEPKMIISQTKDGKPLIRGYAGHFFKALAKKHNANLSTPIINKVLSAQQLIPFVLNKTYEISAATTYPDIPMDWFTYPYDSVNFCLMLPIESSIPIYEIFMVIFRWETLLITIGIIVILSALLESATFLSGRKTFLLNYVFNDNCLRGALGQSFIEIQNATYNIKLIYLLICLIGILLVTSYNAFLQTYMTSPPSEKRIESFDDLLASGIKVYSLRLEFDFLASVAPKFKKKYFDMFLFETEFAKYLKLRDSFDIKFAYMVNNVKWTLVQEQQRIFTQPLFRQPEGMCFFESIPMAFPINENSIYKDIINFLILEIQSSGLLEFWQRRAFNELIDAGKLKLVDLTSKPEFVPLKVEDLKLIWIGMGLAFVLVTLCFVGEICTFKWKSRKEIRQRRP